MTLDPASFETIAACLLARSGLAIGPDKIYLLEGRLGPVLRRHALADLPRLAERLRHPGSDALAREVAEAMTTNESSFFRDDRPFVQLTGTVLPRLRRARPPGTPIRIWSAAASTGQEAYSVAMSVADDVAALRLHPIEILGTDISRDALARARAGTYTQFEVQRGLPIALMLRHFTRQGADWRISPAIRATVNFREWNLLETPAPLGMFDVIFCRNVLIYFDLATKRRVLEAIGRQLRPDGVLFLGGAETTLGITDQLRPLSGQPGAYGHTAACHPAAETGGIALESLAAG